NILQTRDLVTLLSCIGRNEKLGLTGRPPRRIRTLATSQVYVLNGENTVFLPAFLHQDGFYLGLDNRLLSSHILAEFSYIKRHWCQDGVPLVTLLIDEPMLKAQDSHVLLTLLQEINQQKTLEGDVALVGLSEALEQAGKEMIKNVQSFDSQALRLTENTYHQGLTSHLTSGKDPEFSNQRFAYESLIKNYSAPATKGSLIDDLKIAETPLQQLSVLKKMKEVFGLEHVFFLTKEQQVSVRVLIEEIYAQAKIRHDWSLIRMSNGLLDIFHQGLEDALSEISARQKRLVVGRSYSQYGVFEETLTSLQIHERVKQHCGDDPKEVSLNEEFMLFIAILMRENRNLFDGMISIRTSYLIHLCTAQLAKESKLTYDIAFEKLAAFSPYDILKSLNDVLVNYDDTINNLHQTEELHFIGAVSDIHPIDYPEKSNSINKEERDWSEWRKKNGIITRVPEEFYSDLWQLFRHCHGIVIGDKFDVNNRIDSNLIQGSMTASEQTFELLIEDRLNQIANPEYRHLTLEVLFALIRFTRANPDVAFKDYLVTEIIVCHAVRLHWLRQYPAQEPNYEQCRGQAWDKFYALAPHGVAIELINALHSLLAYDEQAHVPL
ncbi:MAG: hypothetical protein AAGB12_12535, partial [Pseudomonadota bacterium]